MPPDPIADLPASDDWLSSVAEASETGRAVAAVDWSATSLGPPSTWAKGLRAAVEICLTTRFPMLVTWGPDLVMIYNDGYRDIIGDKHPSAIGAPLRDAWAEVWDIVEPLTEQVRDERRPTWAEHQPLLIDRNGFLEETYFTFSYSPLFDDDGKVAGVLDVAVETTAQVVAQRRLACLTSLNAALFGAEHVTEVCVAATRALSAWSDDIVSADLFLRVGDEPVLISSTREIDMLDVPMASLLDVMSGNVPRRFEYPTAAPAAPAAGFAIPISSVHDGLDGAIHVAPSAVLPLDEPYQMFLTTIANTIARALENAYRRAIEVGEHRHISDTLQAAMLLPASDHPTVAARYRPAARNLAVGGDWYDVIDLGAPQAGGRRRRLRRPRARCGDDDGPAAQRSPGDAARRPRPGDHAAAARRLLGLHPGRVRDERRVRDHRSGPTGRHLLPRRSSAAVHGRRRRHHLDGRGHRPAAAGRRRPSTDERLGGLHRGQHVGDVHRRPLRTAPRASRRRPATTRRRRRAPVRRRRARPSPTACCAACLLPDRFDDVVLVVKRLVADALDADDPDADEAGSFSPA